MELVVGSQWRSAVSSTRVIVVAAPSEPSELRCGGEPVLPHDAPGPVSEAGGAGAAGALLGKRYVDEQSGLEVLCTRAGGGALEAGGRPLELKAAKPLPASD